MTVNATNPTGAQIPYSTPVSATDATDASATLTVGCMPGTLTGASSPIGTTTVNCTARRAAAFSRKITRSLDNSFVQEGSGWLAECFEQNDPVSVGIAQGGLHSGRTGIAFLRAQPPDGKLCEAIFDADHVERDY